MGRRLSRKLCPRLQTATDLLCKRWTGLIVHVLLSAGPQRFNELLGEIEVVSDRMLSERLKELEAQGVVVRRIVGEQPQRIAYALTAKGHAMAPILAALQCWSDQYAEVSTHALQRPPAAAP